MVCKVKSFCLEGGAALGLCPMRRRLSHAIADGNTHGFFLGEALRN